MRFITRYWASILTAGLIPLLIVLAVLQLTWIGEMGERERFRLTQGLFAAAGQLSTAIENEVGVLPAVFGQGGDNDWRSFKKRWETWKTYALDPSFVAGFHIVRPAGGKRPTEVRYWDGERFSIDGTPGLSDALDAAIAERNRGRDFMKPADVGDGTEAMLLPADWNGEYWLAIRIDRKVLNERLIPLLAERYLYGKNEYVFRILNADDQTLYLSDPKADISIFKNRDISIPLVRTDFLVGKLDDGPPPMKPIEAEPGFAIMKTRRSALENIWDPDRKSDLIRLPPPKHGGRETSLWTLEAVHRSGSLAAAVRSETFRSGVVSSGILLILAGVLIIFAIAVRRTQELADRRHEFIATVTHELKTPIAVIRSAAENLADGVVRDMEKTTKYGNVIRRESGKLAEMIDSLLVYARVGDRKSPKSETVDMGAVAMRALESRQEDLIAAGFDVESEIPEGVYVKGDGAALELAVGNLISNAVKHAAEGKFVGMRLSITEKQKNDNAKAPSLWAVLEVRDRGPGIPRKERRLVFDPFYRGESARKSQKPGSGLGLNLVSRIVSAHGGMVFLETQAERGSIIVIRLPLEDTSHA